MMVSVFLYQYQTLPVSDTVFEGGAKRLCSAYHNHYANELHWTGIIDDSNHF